MIHIYTFKDGLLARLAHDLRLHVEAPRVERDGDAVAVSFHADQLRVDGTMTKHGDLDTEELTDANKADILSNVTGEILKDALTIEFKGHMKGTRLVGDLCLGGQTHPIVVDLQTGPEGLSGVLDLVPSAWGIPPYKTMGGAIKLKDHLRVEFSYEQDSE